MYNIILILLLCFFTINTYGDSEQYEKGEKQMATLLINEQISANGLTEPGWYEGPFQAPGYIIEFDSVLNKHVFYENWATHNGNDGGRAPDGGVWGLRHAISPARQEITIHTVTKHQRILQNPNDASGTWPQGDINTHHFHIGRNWGYRSPPNGCYTLMFEYTRQGCWNKHWYSFDGDGSNVRRRYGNSLSEVPATATPMFIFRNCEMDSGQYQHWINRNLNRAWRDGVWYEQRIYIRNNTAGQSNGVVQFDYREWGTENWISVINASGLPLSATAQAGASMNQVMIGSYLHNGHVPNQRSYVGFYRLYAGNAIADGDISGGGGGGTQPVDPLSISNHRVTTTNTAAQLSWNTNRASNTVVDYGPTETRGTVVRGNDNTTDHVVDIPGLTENTTYYYRYSSRDANGNTVMDQANSTFTTKTVTDTTKPVISGVNVTTETTTANVTWTTNENSNSNVDYGTTTAYGKSAAGNADTQNHVVEIAGLTEGTTYNYRVRSADVAGNESVSDNATFVTEKTPVKPVEVSLNDLTDVTLATPVEGQVLMYRNGQWVNVDARPLVAQLVEEILGATSLVVNKPSA